MMPHLVFSMVWGEGGSWQNVDLHFFQPPVYILHQYFAINLHLQNLLTLYNFVQPCTTVNNLVQPCIAFLNLVQPYNTAMMYNLVQYNLVQPCTNVYMVVQPCTNVYMVVQPCNTVYKVVQH